MILFTLSLKIFLGIVFLSTGIEKLYNYSSHKQNIKNYQIVQEKLIPIIAFFDLLLELVIALFLIIGIYDAFALILGLILLLFYTIAITINLTKDNKFKCGCGGIAGDTMISWKLVIRNLILILSVVFLIISHRYMKTWNENVFNSGFELNLFSLQYILLVSIVFLLTLTYITAKGIFKVNKTEVE